MCKLFKTLIYDFTQYLHLNALQAVLECW